MTKDELLKLRHERRKQVLNIGDKVKAISASGKPLYDGKTATIIEKGMIGNEVYYGLYIEGVTVEKRSTPIIGKSEIIGNTSLLAPFYAEDLELMKEPKPKFNVGDKVRFGEVGKPMQSGVIMGIHHIGTYCVYSQDGKIQYVPEEALNRDPEPTAEEEAAKIPLYSIGTKVHTIYGDGVVDKTIYGNIAVRLDNGGFCGLDGITAVKEETDDDWQSYRMELAAKIAVAYAEKGRYEPEEIGAEAVEVANGVVERLKK